MATTRRKERSQALELLFEMDLTGHSLIDVVNNKKKAVYSFEISDFTARLIKGVVSNKSWIDSVIERFSHEWKLNRMPAVDRNILRIGIFEIFFEPDIPIPVTINECVELAKIYSNSESRKFINGLLGRVVEHYDKLSKEIEGGKVERYG